MKSYKLYNKKEEEKSFKEKMQEILKYKRVRYFGIAVMLLIFTIALNIAFSSFMYRDTTAVANIKVAGMEYAMTIDSNPTRIVKGNANDVTIVEVEITAANKYASKYELIYKVCTTSSCSAYQAIPNDFEVMYSMETEDSVTGEIGTTGTKTITIAIINDTASDVWIELGINAGYAHNTLALEELIINEYASCQDYFADGSLAEQILSDNGGCENIEEITVFEDNPAHGLFITDDDYRKSYYYRGNHDEVNNWVEFAGYYWRVIRVDGNGDIRMIYNGVANGNPQETGPATQFGTSAFNTNQSSNAYLGYMYGNPAGSTYAAVHAKITDSTIKTAVDAWYNSHLGNQESDVTDKIKQDAVYCGDRGLASEEVYAALEYPVPANPGIGAEPTMYQIYNRAFTDGTFSASPSFKCQNNVGGSVPVDNDQYPLAMGLINADEIIYAGSTHIFIGVTPNNWLVTGQDYWTMTPNQFFEENRIDAIFMSSLATLIGDDINSVKGLRGVITLNANVEYNSGAGTIGDPYIIQ